jgi:hypothetical protein
MNQTLGYEDPLSNPKNLREAFSAITHWLQKHDCKITTGRFAEYTEFLRYMEHCEKYQIKAPKYNMLELASFHREIAEIAFVFSRFAGKESDITVELLKKTLQGHALPTDNPAAEKCRNYLLQLRAAVYFMDSGFDVSVNSDADVVAKKDNKTYYIECKRLYSLSQVEKRVRELEDQLLARFREHSGGSEAFGIGWIDPTSIFTGRIGMYSAYSRAASQVAVRVDLNLFANQCPFDRLKKDPRILAVALQMVWPSLCGNEEAPIATGFTSIICPLVSEDLFREKVRPLFDKLLKIKRAAESEGVNSDS